ncbi:serine/threonine-protein kinase [Streptomyces sp. MB09-01]|uniref:serine/threonine-protein kinase n=1 Tax=Streptomyces sp. MB09-01 TaxID=3028666 RepID=UPI0029BA78C8|nr:serine/threonine-protein kinase [Streptomyces sp. MB09-01]MDX3536635.1 serine/threonine-protein kinase [Streptomyces sp. MB09-01]
MTDRLIGDRYQLASILGQGGMGQVWTAYDKRLDRRVAVKLLRPDKVAGPGTVAEELRRRFVRECRVTAQVDHPGLVTVHDAGSDGDELFLVMGYVEGTDLADHLAEHGPYPWQWAVAVVAQLCSVLSAVHAVPIVHRDLKPRNVMIRPDGTVLVLDLGVASVMDTDTTRLTSTGTPIGSPAYMAPEQAMSGAVGPYTDLYALGVLLYELLSGNVPFAGSTALGVLHRHLYEPPALVRPKRPEIPQELETLLMRLLAKDPQDRPGSAQAVYEARKLLDQGRLTQAGDILGGILPAAAAEHGEHSPVVRSLRKQYAATLMDDGQYRRALPELRRLADEFPAGDPQSLRFRYDAAQCLEQLGEPAAALAEYRSLLPLFENHYANPDPGLPLEVRRRIAHLLLSLGDRQAAHETLARLLFDADRLHGPAHPFPAEIRRTLHWLGQVR